MIPDARLAKVSLLLFDSLGTFSMGPRLPCERSDLITLKLGEREKGRREEDRVSFSANILSCSSIFDIKI